MAKLFVLSSLTCFAAARRVQTLPNSIRKEHVLWSNCQTKYDDTLKPLTQLLFAHSPIRSIERSRVGAFPSSRRHRLKFALDGVRQDSDGKHVTAIANSHSTQGIVESLSRFHTPVMSLDRTEATLNLEPTQNPTEDSWANFPDEALALGVSPLDQANVKLLDLVKPRTWANPNSDEIYDLVAVGGGAGGLVSAKQSARRGVRSALIEKHLAGGDCLVNGCVPSKSLLHSAKSFRHSRQGLSYPELDAHFGEAMLRLRNLRAAIAPDDAAETSKEVGTDVYIGEADFVDSHSLQVGGHTIRFRKAVIATGGRPSVPDWCHKVPFTTANDLFNLEHLPPRAIVVGSGAIGLEMAQSLALLGSQVTVLVRSRVMNQASESVSQVVQAALERDGVVFLHGSVERAHVLDSKIDSYFPLIGVEGKVNAKPDASFALEAELLLIATGRTPVFPIGLDTAGVDYDSRGVIVNDLLQTSNPDIYAVGDVVKGGYKFTHMAGAMAQMVIENSFFSGDRRLSALAVPQSVYTDPEIASVSVWGGAPKGTAKFKSQLSFNHRGILDGVTEGFVEIEVSSDSKIVAGTIIAPNAGEMISTLTVAIQLGSTMDALSRIMFPYPTLSEGIAGCIFQWRAKKWPDVSALG